MEIDLAQTSPSERTHFAAEVCIVGAGIAGLTLAQRLNQQGISVALLESGGHLLEDAVQSALRSAELTGIPHQGTHEGRFQVLGGSSLRWGGQLLPLAAGSSQSARWPIATSELEPFYRQTEDLLGVDDLPYRAPAFFRRAGLSAPALLRELPGLDAVMSKWTPVSRRNLARRLGRELLSGNRTTVYLHAAATELVLTAEGSRLATVRVRTPAGITVRFTAKHFVVAAGTVETVRLLLMSRAGAPAGVGNAHGQVGRNFHDHLTLPAATLTGDARATFLRELGFWVLRDRRPPTVHSAKLCASAALQQRLKLNPVLAHVTLEEPAGSGLAAVRGLLLAGQRGELRSGFRQYAGEISRALREGLRLLWAAEVNQRRYVSPQAVVRLRLNAAQDASSLSRITLSDTLAADGQPQARVHWHHSEQEKGTLRRFAHFLQQQFSARGLQGFDWHPGLLGPAGGPLDGLEDARHAMGGASMGTDPATSVVTPELQVHGIGNLWLASPATFPDGSPHLPTLPLMALTLRLAGQISRRLAQER